MDRLSSLRKSQRTERLLKFSWRGQWGYIENGGAQIIEAGWERAHDPDFSGPPSPQRSAQSALLELVASWLPFPAS
jgi:hypothetical protein